MNAQDGGPAFPVPEMHLAPNTKQACESQGMSLRDWFAGMALQSLVSQDPTKSRVLDNPNGRTLNDWFAMNAYGFADAMLEARKEEA